METIYRHRLDTFYLATVGYFVTLVAYMMIVGFWIDDRFELVWKDPIVYLLGACAAFSLLALIVAAILNRKVIVREHELVFRTRFKERILRPEQIEWIAFRREPRASARAGTPFMVARFRLRSRRRRFVVRPGGFEGGLELTRALRDWAVANGIETRSASRRKRRRGAPSDRQGLSDSQRRIGSGDEGFEANQP